MGILLFIKDTTATLAPILVLNTVIKMQKNEFCLNFYTAVLNTKSAGHPDYANAVSIFKSNVVSNTSYTVPFDGILTLVASSISSAGSVSASVNGVTIANWRDNGASSSSSSTGANVFTVPVKNGDIVVLGASNNAFFTTSSRLVPYS